MATKEKTPKQLNKSAYAAKRLAAATPVLNAAAEAWPLERRVNGIGWSWTTDFVAYSAVGAEPGACVGLTVSSCVSASFFSAFKALMNFLGSFFICLGVKCLI
jgi:hypothetical protein